MTHTAVRRKDLNLRGSSHESANEHEKNRNGIKNFNNLPQFLSISIFIALNAKRRSKTMIQGEKFWETYGYHGA